MVNGLSLFTHYSAYEQVGKFTREMVILIEYRI